MSDMTTKAVVYRAPGMDQVKIRRDVESTIDLYYPPNAKDEELLPAVVIVAGYSDFREPAYFNCKFKEMGWVVSWAKLMATTGIIAVTYSTREPVADLRALLEFLRLNSETLGIDAGRIGLFAGSGNVPNALSALMDGGIKAAAFSCGFTLDLDRSTVVADAARTYGFVNPAAGKSVEDLPKNVPLLLVRAGQDQFAGLNGSMDRFIANALASNLPITVINHASGPHAFDLFDETETSRRIIRDVLAFLVANVG